MAALDCRWACRTVSKLLGRWMGFSSEEHDAGRHLVVWTLELMEGSIS